MNKYILVAKCPWCDGNDFEETGWRETFSKGRQEFFNDAFCSHCQMEVVPVLEFKTTDEQIKQIENLYKKWEFRYHNLKKRGFNLSYVIYHHKMRAVRQMLHILGIHIKGINE